jgi:hypothetical protein
LVFSATRRRGDRIATSCPRKSQLPLLVAVSTRDHRSIDEVTLLFADCIWRQPYSPRTRRWRKRL